MKENDWFGENYKDEYEQTAKEKALDKFKNTPNWVDKASDILALLFIGAVIVFVVVVLLWASVEILEKIFS